MDLFFAVLLSVFSLSHFHPQWGVWLAPFLVLFFTLSNARLAYYLINLSFFGFVFPL